MDFDLAILFPGSRVDSRQAEYYKLLRERIHNCVVLNHEEISHNRRRNVRDVVCTFYMNLYATLDPEHYNHSCDVCGKEAVEWQDAIYRPNYNVRPRPIEDMKFSELLLYIEMESVTNDTPAKLKKSCALHLLGCLNKLSATASEERLHEGQLAACALLTRMKLLFNDQSPNNCECVGCSDEGNAVYDTPKISSDGEMGDLKKPAIE